MSNPIDDNEFPDRQDLDYMQWENVSPSLKFLYVPHRLTFLLTAAIIVFCSRPTTVIGITVYVWVVSSVIIATFLQDSPMVRPHPFFWRLVLAFTLVQAFSCFFFSFLDKGTQMKYLKSISPSTVGQPAERDYAMSCVIYDRNNPKDPFHSLKSITFDEYVPAHFIGWILQSFIVRDKKICWIVSILFEFMERGLKHWFPNFAECWWDSFVLDVLLTNGIGIEIGMRLVNLFQYYPWEKRLYDEIKTQPAKLKRLLSQFTPRSFARFEWRPLESPRRYLSCVMIGGMLMYMMLVLFGLKMIYGMLPTNPFILMYMILDAIVGVPAAYELYLYATEKRDTIGNYTTATFLLGIMQSLVVYRSHEGYFTEPIPFHVKVFSSVFFASLVLFPFVWFPLKRKSKTKTE